MEHTVFVVQLLIPFLTDGRLRKCWSPHVLYSNIRCGPYV